MAAASDSVVTVFGGTGFLGCRIVRHLRLHGFCVRVASRHPDRGHALLGPDDPQLRSVNADVHDERSVADALADAYGVVNAVSLYVEQGWETFHSVHVESAQRVTAQAQRAGVKRLVHVSGIGADPRNMDEPFDSRSLRLSCDPLGRLDVDGMKRLPSLLDVEADCIYYAVSISKRIGD